MLTLEIFVYIPFKNFKARVLQVGLSFHGLKKFHPALENFHAGGVFFFFFGCIWSNEIATSHDLGPQNVA